VGIGVALSLLLQLNTEAMDLTVVELVPRDGGQFEERPAPATLTSHHVTVLDVYGSLLYAGSRTLQAHLPDPAGTQAPAVVLRLRGRTSLGATFIKVATTPTASPTWAAGFISAACSPASRSGSIALGPSTVPCARSRRPLSWENPPTRLTWMLNLGWSNGASSNAAHP
jgi:hypothetical protein